MRPTPDFWITRIDEADARGSRARDRETIEIEYPSAARGRRCLIGDELLADDFVDSARGTRQGLCRTSAVRSGNPRNVSSHQSRARCFDMVTKDDLVATNKTFTGTHAGTIMGIPATGRRASFDAFDLMRLRDGKVVDHWVVFDGAGLMRQLGVLPPTRPEGLTGGRSRPHTPTTSAACNRDGPEPSAALSDATPSVTGRMSAG